VDEALLPLFTPCMLPHLRHRADVVAVARQWLSEFRPGLDAVAQRAASERLDRTREMHQQEVAAGWSRRRAQELVSIGEGLMIQGGLFDRRSEREAEQRQLETEEQAAPTSDPEMRPATPSDVALAERPELQLVLMVTPL
jgi:hypothetical protein